MTQFIIDASSHNPGLPIEDLKRQGFAGLIVKCTQGSNYQNPLFNDYISRGINSGLLVGAYHWPDGSNFDTQVRNISNVVPKYIPIWQDVEGSTPTSYADEVSSRLRTQKFKVPGYYGKKPSTGAWWRAAYLNDPSGFASTVYQIQGGDTSNVWDHGEDMWQFCQHGVVSKYTGDVDFSAFRGSFSDLMATGWFYASGSITPPPTLSPPAFTGVTDMFLASFDGTVYLVGSPKAPYVAFNDMNKVHHWQTVVPTADLSRAEVEAIYGPIPPNVPVV